MTLLASDVASKRLQGITNTQDSIETTSMWIMHHSESIRVITEAWLNLFRASTDEHRVTLFYLLNDVVQRAKKKHLDSIVSSFEQPAISSIAIGRNSEKVKGVMGRCLKLIAECKAFSAASLDRMEKNLASDTGEADDTFFEVDNMELSRKVEAFTRSVFGIEKALATVRQGPVDLQQEMHTRMKDRKEGAALIRETKYAISAMQRLREVVAENGKAAYELMEYLEQSKRAFTQQLRDVAFVEDAYVKFGQGIREVQEEVEEMLKTGVYPAGTPPRDAPSPVPDDDVFAEGIDNVLNSFRPRDVLEDAPMDVDTGDDDEPPLPNYPAPWEKKKPVSVPFTVPTQPTAAQPPVMNTMDPRSRQHQDLLRQSSHHPPSNPPMATIPSISSLPPSVPSIPRPSPMSSYQAALNSIQLPPTGYSQPPPGFSIPLPQAPPPASAVLNIPPPRPPSAQSSLPSLSSLPSSEMSSAISSLISSYIPSQPPPQFQQPPPTTMSSMSSMPYAPPGSGGGYSMPPPSIQAFPTQQPTYAPPPQQTQQQHKPPQQAPSQSSAGYGMGGELGGMWAGAGAGGWVGAASASSTQYVPTNTNAPAPVARTPSRTLVSPTGEDSASSSRTVPSPYTPSAPGYGGRRHMDEMNMDDDHGGKNFTAMPTYGSGKAYGGGGGQQYQDHQKYGGDGGGYGRGGGHNQQQQQNFGRGGPRGRGRGFGGGQRGRGYGSQQRGGFQNNQGYGSYGGGGGNYGNYGGGQGGYGN